MVEDLNEERRGCLERRIAGSMEELRQLHLKPTLDDFQNFWKEKLEIGLSSLRHELRELPSKERNAPARR
jgi:hypothetical protein